MADEQETNQQASSNQLVADGQTPVPRLVIKLDPNKVPPELHFLIPYAEKWGIQDKQLRRTLLHQAGLSELEELERVVSSVQHDLSRSLNFPPLDEPGSPEAGAFAALIMAAGRAESILEEARERTQEQPPAQSEQEISEPADAQECSLVMTGKRWLEQIGWPDHYPAIKLDPTKVPPELQSLIPFAEKWGIGDDVIRGTVIEEASTGELQEFLAVLEKVGIDQVRGRALKMSYDEAQHKEGNILLALLEAAEEAELEVEQRIQHPSQDEAE